ncbi:MAG: phosphatase PAP2 family protein [Alphaproteobacteria bacterium]|nr:phosphatase PAP2 family protein [Alphaproteobacteria bacterium]
MKAFVVYLGVVAFTLAIFLFAPEVDLATSGLFYDPERGFVLANWPPILLLFHAIPWIAWGTVILAAIGVCWLLLLGKPLWRLDRKALIFLVASTAAGPGLLANTLLKDHWGRARPAQIEAFGGAHRFTPAPLPAVECDRNCAFVSGHAALAFSLVSLAFLLPPGDSRRRGVVAALGFGALVGLGRIAQGAHFLSDVVYAGLLVYGSTALLYWWIVDCDGLAAPALLRFYRLILRIAVAAWDIAHRARGSPVSRLLFSVAALTLLVVISIRTADRPLALFFDARDQDLRSLFDVTGRLGLTYGYLTIFGLAFVALHWGGVLPRLQQFALPLRALSGVPAFLFVSIAGSGIVVDVLKVLFGRPRPKLLFQSDVYGFTWLSWRPDHWSFPSGHSATIVALMTGLWLFWPQHLLFYILVAVIVCMSRVVVGAHYLGDSLAGALIAVLTTRYAAHLFTKAGIDLAAARHGLSASGDAPPWPCRRLGGASIGRDRAGSR